MSTFKLYNGDCLEVLRKCPDNYIDAIVTDPPYGLSFMGKKWDYDVPSVEIWKECLRVLKPGGHLLAFGGTRTYHRLVVAIEDAGFEIRDQIQWIYSQGFPKSQNIQKEGLKKGQCCGCETEPQYPVQTVSNSDLSPTLSASQTGLVLQSDLQESDVSPQGQAHGTGVNEGSEQPGLEGRNNFQTQQGELRGSEVRSVPARVSGNGAKGRVRDGASLSHGQTLEQTTNTNGSGSPQRPQHPQQPTKQSRTVAGQPKSQNRRIGEACGECGKPVIPGGLGTALKPANEPICLARKPLAESTIAKNVLKYGTGGLNIDACRVSISENDPNHRKPSVGYADGSMFGLGGREGENLNAAGRFPSNVILDEAAAQVLDGQSGVSTSKSGGKAGAIGYHSGGKGADRGGHDDKGGASRFFKTITQDEECSVNTVKLSLNQLNQLGDFVQRLVAISERQDTNLSAILKAFTLAMQNELNKQGESSTITIQSIVERYSHELWLTSMSSSSPASDAEARMLTDTMKIIHGLSTLFSSAEAVTSNTMLKSKELGVPASPNRFAYVAKASKSDRNACVDGSQSKVVNNHSTVKPIKLMEYLCKLVTPPSGVVLDPFMGSGTTGVAALRNGFQFRGIEREEQYFYISQARLEKEQGDAE